jgi:hypothetical protein
MSQLIEQRTATLLGNFGLLPFYALAAVSWVPLGARADRLIELAFVAYAAAILSFLGAVHWGFVLSTPGLDRNSSKLALRWGVIPSLLGWLALMMALAGAPLGLVAMVLAIDFALCRLMDARLLVMYATPPAWYLPLRTRLTALVIVAVLIFMGSTL